MTHSLPDLVALPDTLGCNSDDSKLTALDVLAAGKGGLERRALFNVNTVGSAARTRITHSLPVSIARSRVVHGATTMNGTP